MENRPRPVVRGGAEGIGERGGATESGDTPLQDAIDLYERGDQLRRLCAERLDAAQARVEAIRLDAAGQPAGTRPFAAG